MRLILKTLCLFIPIAAFIGSLLKAMEWWERGSFFPGLAWTLTGLVLLVLSESFMVQKWILPTISNAVSQRLYGGRYCPDDDALATLVSRIQAEGDAQALPELRTMVERDPHRLRGWMELAHLQRTLQHNTEGAVATMLEAEKRIRSRQDKAMLLYRAAHLCESDLRNTERARNLYAAAAQYKKTVYGKKASSRLNKA